ncbi:glycosyltransferase [uncultured Roseivirga sp.]|uniref:glycosyltransferase n=1 Tax=uncultured Roseivirga sp. TaxID=543088 RepID=UPI000D7B543E|nr:glycosyltransferase [uncultured Roseivirga sp.]PWL28996.1 MAG: hypothetical protein DCO95_11175 [Roseivirga sp. XM-24bin3]
MLLIYSVLFLWSVLLIAVLILWTKLKNKFEFVDKPCSVIIPFRNEEATLVKLVKAFSRQSVKSAEFIFVNDHSEDRSVELLREALKKYSLQAKVLEVTEVEGKKAALSLGISEASNEFIITTDADCQMNEHWLASLLNQFEVEEVKMVLGPVVLTGEGFWQKFQSLEMSALMGVTAVSAYLNKPTMANGANLAFRKSVFEELEGYRGIDEIPTGDDELFMHKIQLKYPGSILFTKDSRAVVQTAGAEGLSSMINQKKRWASKWKFNKRWSTILLALFILLVNLAQCFLIYDFLTDPIASRVSIWVLWLKFMSELFLLLQVRHDLGQRTNFLSFIISFLFYPLYAIYIGIAANFGSYQWKGRKYS